MLHHTFSRLPSDIRPESHCPCISACIRFRSIHPNHYGWGGLTENECMQKCTDNATPDECPKEDGRKCGAALFYPHAKGASTGWCHLYTKTACGDTEEDWAYVVALIKQRSSEKWDVTSNIAYLGAPHASPLFFGMGACALTVCGLLVLFRRGRQWHGLPATPADVEGDELFQLVHAAPFADRECVA